MSRSYFKVDLENFELRGLNDKSIYLQLQFAGFKTFNTRRHDAVRNNNSYLIRWDFSNVFFYNTSFANLMKTKYLVVTAFRRRVLNDKPLGSASVDLYTIATGAKKQDLKLVNKESGDGIGRVSFNIEMVEIVKHMNIVCSSMSVLGWGATIATRPRDSVFLQITTTEDERQLVESPGLPATQAPRWTVLPDLTISTDMEAICEDELHVVMNAFVGQGRQRRSLGQAQVPVIVILSRKNNRLHFKLPLTTVQGQKLSLEGDISIRRGPQFAQMLGGVNMGHAVVGGRFVVGFPRPENHVPDKEDEGKTSGPRRGSRQPQKRSTSRPVEQKTSSSSDSRHGGLVNQRMAPSVPLAVSVPLSGVQQQPVQTPITYTAVAQPLQMPSQTPMGGKLQRQVSAPSSREEVKFQKVAHPRKPHKADQMVPMPRGWKTGLDHRNGNVYFKYRPSKKTTWLDPRFLPQGWHQRLDRHGRIYYAHSLTRATTWVDPRGLPDHWTVEFQAEQNAYKLWFLYHPQNGGVPVRCSIDPRGLPPGFTQHVTDKGRVFYKNHDDKSTSWEDPRKNWPRDSLTTFFINARRAWEQKMLIKAAGGNVDSLSMAEFAGLESKSNSGGSSSRPRTHSTALSQNTRPAPKAFTNEAQALRIMWESAVEHLDSQYAAWERKRSEQWALDCALLESKFSSTMDGYEAPLRRLRKQQQRQLEAWQQRKLVEMDRERRAMVAKFAEEEKQAGKNNEMDRLNLMDEREKALEAIERKKESEIAGRRADDAREREKKKLDFERQMRALCKRYEQDFEAL